MLQSRQTRKEERASARGSHSGVGRGVGVDNSPHESKIHSKRREKTLSAPADLKAAIASPKGRWYLTAAGAERYPLNITSIVINSLSISLSALTSLDWKKQATHERAFAEMLLQVGHVHEGGEGSGKVCITEQEAEHLKAGK